MRLITTYAPPTFTRPCLIVSTQVHYPEENADESEFDVAETAIMFVKALNAEVAIIKAFSELKDLTIIKKHKSKDEAIKFHEEMAYKLCYGYNTEKEDHYSFYCDYLFKYGNVNYFGIKSIKIPKRLHKEE